MTEPHRCPRRMFIYMINKADLETMFLTVFLKIMCAKSTTVIYSVNRRETEAGLYQSSLLPLQLLYKSKIILHTGLTIVTIYNVSAHEKGM